MKTLCDASEFFLNTLFVLKHRRKKKVGSHLFGAPLHLLLLIPPPNPQHPPQHPSLLTKIN